MFARRTILALFIKECLNPPQASQLPGAGIGMLGADGLQAGVDRLLGDSDA